MESSWWRSSINKKEIDEYSSILWWCYFIGRQTVIAYLSHVIISCCFNGRVRGVAIVQSLTNQWIDCYVSDYILVSGSFLDGIVCSSVAYLKCEREIVFNMMLIISVCSELSAVLGTGAFNFRSSSISVAYRHETFWSYKPLWVLYDFHNVWVYTNCN